MLTILLLKCVSYVAFLLHVKWAGLLHIFDREFCDLFAWTTLNGSVVFRIARDKEYWAMMEHDLHSFWYNHVLPARQMKEDGKHEREEIIMELGSSTVLGENSEHAKEIKARGKELVKKAEEIRFKPKNFSNEYIVR